MLWYTEAKALLYFKFMPLLKYEIAFQYKLTLKHQQFHTSERYFLCTACMQLFYGKHPNHNKRLNKQTNKKGNVVLKNPSIVSHSEKVKSVVDEDRSAKN